MTEEEEEKKVFSSKFPFRSSTNVHRSLSAPFSAFVRIHLNALPVCQEMAPRGPLGSQATCRRPSTPNGLRHQSYLQRHSRSLELDLRSRRRSTGHGELAWKGDAGERDSDPANCVTGFEIHPFSFPRSCRRHILRVVQPASKLHLRRFQTGIPRHIVTWWFVRTPRGIHVSFDVFAMETKSFGVEESYFFCRDRQP